MNRIRSVLHEENLICGYLYFYVHFIVEVVSFYFLSKVSNSSLIWLIPFLYDAFAFVPQGLIGYFKDKYAKVNFGIIGIIMLFIGIVLLGFNINKFVLLFFITIGNACVHVEGAINTLRSSKGKLSHSAIFVSGGSFGVILGRILARTSVSSWFLLPLVLTCIPFILYANTFNNKDNCNGFDYVKKNLNPLVIIILAVFVVTVRGYMGYGIPTSWNKTTIESVYLFFIMGIGKALGGILSDAYGVKKIAIISTIIAIPFLCIGDNLMIISLIGVMFFSMTMSITLAILVSVLKKTPGLAFGLTTIGLFLGTVPIFFIQIASKSVNILLIIFMSIMCTFILSYILRGDKSYD